LPIITNPRHEKFAEAHKSNHSATNTIEALHKNRSNIEQPIAKTLIRKTNAYAYIAKDFSCINKALALSLQRGMAKTAPKRRLFANSL
jgi:hypothetical protein